MRIPKYRRHTLRECAFVEYHGKRIYLPGRYDSPESRAAYQRLVAQIQAADEGETPHVGPVTVAELMDFALDEAVRRYVNPDGSPSSEYGHFRLISEIVLEAVGAITVEEFGPKWLMKIRQLMVDRGWARVQTNRQVNRLRRMFRWGVAHELVPPAVIAALREVEPLREGRTTAPETDDVHPVDLDLVEATIPWVGPVVGTMIRIQALTGMRGQNVCNLRPCDLVAGDAGVLLYAPGHHKNTWRGAKLIVPLGPRAIETLIPWLEREPTDYVFSPQESERIRKADRRYRRKSKVQPSQMDRSTRRPRRPPSDCYGTQEYYKAIQRGVKKLNAARAKAGFPPLPVWHPHQLRHTVGTVVRKKYGLEGAQVALGHDAIDSTQIYAEKNLELACQIAREMG